MANKYFIGWYKGEEIWARGDAEAKYMLGKVYNSFGTRSPEQMRRDFQVQSGNINRFTFDSQRAGYPTTRTDIKGSQATMAPEENVMGYPTRTIKEDGSEKVMYATQNLTGQPIQTSDPNVIKNLKDDKGNAKENVFFEERKHAPSTFHAGGNITGWPVLYQVTHMGQIETKFVMPGYLEPGNLDYDTEISGIPQLKTPYDHWLEDEYKKQQFAAKNAPEPTVGSVQAPIQEVTSQQLSSTQLTDLQAGKRRRTKSGYSTILSDDDTGLLGA